MTFTLPHSPHTRHCWPRSLVALHPCIICICIVRLSISIPRPAFRTLARHQLRRSAFRCSQPANIATAWQHKHIQQLILKDSYSSVACGHQTRPRRSSAFCATASLCGHGFKLWLDGFCGGVGCVALRSGQEQPGGRCRPRSRSRPRPWLPRTTTTKPHAGPR